MVRDPSTLAAAGVTVRIEPRVVAGTLRYFDADGGFAAGVAAVLGTPIPAALGARQCAFPTGSSGMLIWRSPTETWVVGGDSRCHAALERYAEGRDDGCYVDQTGGIVALSVTGANARGLLARLGSAAPEPGQALTARFADVAVTAACCAPEEIWMLVERVHAQHLRAWIGETLADW
jgi:sarcosine oxidase gamma subunit